MRLTYRIALVLLAVLLAAAGISPHPSPQVSASGTLPTGAQIIQALKTKHPGKGHPLEYETRRGRSAAIRARLPLRNSGTGSILPHTCRRNPQRARLS